MQATVIRLGYFSLKIQKTGPIGLHYQVCECDVPAFSRSKIRENSHFGRYELFW
jgi:hypothetical protein